MNGFAIILLIALCTPEDIFLGEKFQTGAYPTGRGGNDIFYWLFEARTKTTEQVPLVIWFNGGPGCSSMYGTLAENGPYNMILQTPVKIVSNKYSWTNLFDVMYIDQPSGVGFSKITTQGCSDIDCVTKDVYVFLIKFISAHPQYQNTPIYLSGESYAGHYIPKLAEYIINQNSSYINLKGVAIGNGWYVGTEQMQSYPAFAYEKGLISIWKYLITSVIFWFSKLVALMGMYDKAEILNDEIGVGFLINDKFDQYDYKRKEEIPFDKYLIEFMAIPEVVERMNTTDRPYFKGEDYSCNGTFEELLLPDTLLSMEGAVKTMINANIKILFYTGDLDFICNVLSQEMWLNKMSWAGQSAFINDDYVDWVIDNKKYGQYKKYKNVMHLVVNEASHMVPVEQPYATNVMINDFILSEIK